MTPHLLLRLAIYAIGINSAAAGIMQFAYYTHLGISDPFDPANKLMSGVLAYATLPLLLAFGCLGFGRAIATALLGPDTRATIELRAVDTDANLRLLLRAIGVYLFTTTIGPAVATIFEIIALETGNTRLDAAKVFPDAVSNGLSLAASFMLTLQTKKILALITTNTETRARD